MSALSRLLSVAVICDCLATCCVAAEAKPSLDTVLARWEAATAKVKTLDAKVYRWKYDLVFGSPKEEPPCEEGRFYCEGEKAGCLQIKSAKPAAWNGLAEMIVWQEKHTLVIDGEHRTCTKYVWPDSIVRDGQPKDGIWPGFAAFLRAIQYPKKVLPLVLDVHADEIRDRYVLTFEDQGDRYLVVGLPKKAREASWYSRIEVLVDSKTYLTTAVQRIAPNGKDRTVWMLEDMKINERPRDLDQLLSPDLNGLVIHEVK